jgi:peptidoglycan/xylan/chitin deacetylase (PgdA/CDA1 family)
VSYYVVEPPRRGRVAVRTLAAGFGLLVALMLLAGWTAARPIWVTVDGHRHLLARGATTDSLARSSILASPPGRLLSVDGNVLDETGGEPPGAIRNGELARTTEVLHAGDVVTSVPGEDREESLEVTNVPIPFETAYRGSGPMVEIETLGAPGIRRVTRGAVSGIEVTSTVVHTPDDMIVRRFRPTGKVVALTFDDGPWPTHTGQILKVLQEEGVDATFFMLGRQVDRNPGIARRAVDEGNEVGVHSYSHRPFPDLTAKQVRSEVKRSRESVKRATGRSTLLLRPPYGSMNGRAWKAVRDTGAHVVMWDVDSRDWTKPGAKRIEKTVLRTVRPGSVILFHDGGGNRAQTVSAVRGVIRELKARGYQFVTVGELYETRGQAASRR